jgi:hypothetical protein
MELLEAQLKDKLKALGEVKRTWEKECADIQLQMEDMEAEYHKKSAPFESQCKALEIEIKDMTIRLARSFKCSDGEVTFKKGSVRVSYESKSIDKICSTDPGIRKLLLPFRKEMQVSPSIKVEVF